MKKLALLVACFCCAHTFGQNGFFLKPTAGIGFTGINNTTAYYYTGLPFSISQAKQTTTYNAKVLAGYQLKNWALETGIALTRSGCRGGYLAEYYRYKFVAFCQYYNHAMLPLMLSYQINIGPKISLIPSAGAAVSYNYGAVVADGDSKEKLTNSAFNAEYARVSCWGLAKLQVCYKLNGKISIVAGPEAQYMVTPFTKAPTNNTTVYGIYFGDNQKDYLYTFNAGVKWSLGAKK